jgi:chromosome segregation ATPase
MESKEREVAGLAQKALTKDASWKDQAAKAKKEVDELQKRLLGSERKIVQMRHEIKRKENEYERLQRRLSKYLADNKKAESAVLDLAGQVSKSLAKSPIKQRQLYQDDNLKTVVTAYESKQSEYKKEIEELRTALMTLQKEHSEALNTVAERRDPKEAVRIVDDEFIQGMAYKR